MRVYTSARFMPFGIEPRAMLMLDGTVVNKMHMLRLITANCMSHSLP